MTIETQAVAVCTNHPDVVEGLARCSRCQRNFCGDCLVTIGGHAYCADCKNEQVLDLRSGIETTRLPLATKAQRFGGFFIDSLVFAPLQQGIAFLTPRTWIFEHLGLWFLVSFGSNFLFIVYEALMLSARGQTLGKMAVKTKVVRADGSAISRGRAWARAVLRTVLAFTFIFDWLPIFFTEERLCLHDMIAGTRVVRLDS